MRSRILAIAARNDRSALLAALDEHLDGHRAAATPGERMAAVLRYNATQDRIADTEVLTDLADRLSARTRWALHVTRLGSGTGSLELIERLRDQVAERRLDEATATMRRLYAAPPTAD